MLFFLHIDSNKWNIKPSNLKVLCLNFHEEEPGHENLVNNKTND